MAQENGFTVFLVLFKIILEELRKSRFFGAEFKPWSSRLKILLMKNKNFVYLRVTIVKFLWLEVCGFSD